MSRPILAICLTLVLITASTALLTHAALPPRSPEDLAADSTLVITGTITESNVTTANIQPSYSNNVFLLKVRIDRVEKGKGVSSGDTLEVSCWQIATRPPGWVGPGGHGNIPKKGTQARFYLVKHADGPWTPLEPNGIEPLPKR